MVCERLQNHIVVDGVLVQCESGSYAFGGNSEESTCWKCEKCDPGMYRKDCGVFDGILTRGTCVPCAGCEEPDEARINCDWRCDRNNAAGVCVRKEYLTETAWCVDLVGSASTLISQDTELNTAKRDTVVSRGLGGFNFEKLFGAAQDGGGGVDFVCSGMCDGAQTYDSTQCGGPYACGVHVCAMRLGEGTTLEAHGCPLERPGTADSASTNLSKHTAECQPCESCGVDNQHSLEDFGRGCAQECSRVLCGQGQIYDWTDESRETINRCKDCAALDDARLCSASDRRVLGLATSDVSGNRARVLFGDCSPQRGIQDISYGKCLACESEVQCAGGRYFARCPLAASSASAVSERECPRCEPRVGAVAAGAQYVDSSGVLRPAYCQVLACADAHRTGIRRDGAVCVDACQSVVCADSELSLACVLPHQGRCVPSYPAWEPGTRTFRSVMPAHANMLETGPAGEQHQFASFENILVDHSETPEHQHQCVWNAIDVVDNNMNPGGVSRQWIRDSDTGSREHVLFATGSKFCTPIKDPVTFDAYSIAWYKDHRLAYPLLPLQNTVAFESAFPRRILLNTSASGVAYACEPRGLDLGSIAWKQMQRPGRVPYAGNVFLNVDLTRSRSATLGVFVPTDRGIGAVAWMPAWRFGLAVQESSAVRDEDSPVRVVLRMPLHNRLDETLLSITYLPDPADVLQAFAGYDETLPAQDVVVFSRAAGATGLLLVGSRACQSELCSLSIPMSFKTGDPGKLAADDGDSLFKSLPGVPAADGDAAGVVVVQMRASRSACLAYYATESTVHCVQSNAFGLLSGTAVYAASEGLVVLSFCVLAVAAQADGIAVLWYQGDAVSDTHGVVVLWPQDAPGVGPGLTHAVQCESTVAGDLLLLQVTSSSDSVVRYRYEGGAWGRMPGEGTLTEPLTSLSLDLTRLPERARVLSALHVHRESGAVFGLFPVRVGDDTCLCMGFLTDALVQTGVGVHCQGLGAAYMVGAVSVAWMGEDRIVVGVQDSLLDMQVSGGAVTVLGIANSFLQHQHFTQSFNAFVAMPYATPVGALQTTPRCVLGYMHAVVPSILEQTPWRTERRCASRCSRSLLCQGYAWDAASFCRFYSSVVSVSSVRVCQRLMGSSIHPRLACVDAVSTVSLRMHTTVVVPDSAPLLASQSMKGFFAVREALSTTVEVESAVTFVSASGELFDSAHMATHVYHSNVLQHIESGHGFVSPTSLQTLSAELRLELLQGQPSLCVVVLPTAASYIACTLSATRHYGPRMVVVWRYGGVISLWFPDSVVDNYDDTSIFCLNFGARIVMNKRISEPPNLAYRMSLSRRAYALLHAETELPADSWTYKHLLINQDDLGVGDMLTATLTRSDVDASISVARTVAVDAVALVPVLSLPAYKSTRVYSPCRHTAHQDYCNDHNTRSGDGCDAGCRLECGFTCDALRCVSRCGDGLRAPDEGCDDENELSGDGCSSLCTAEPGWRVSADFCTLSSSIECVGRDCASCERGQFRVYRTDSCEPCALDTYMGVGGNNGNIYDCAPCGAEMFTSAAGSEACVACAELTVTVRCANPKCKALSEARPRRATTAT